MTPAKPQLNLPHHLTAFVGRTEEIGQIRDLLSDRDCRLLTLIGVGGIGKTRLSIQVAAEIGPQFTHGVYFVPLEAVSTPDLLAPALADGLDLALAGPDEPQAYLFNYLRDKELLLVLDNFEQLIAPPEGVNETVRQKALNLLTHLLQTAPAVKLLVTSREALNLPNEWIYALRGLATPVGIESEGWQDYEAVQLFLSHARRVRQNFEPAAEAEGIIRICHLVEGMPLALELAATWLKSLTCLEIAAEIQRSLDFLTTPMHSVPNRRRSVRAVFEHTWQRLTPTEQAVFARLSIFRGGFRRAAAEAIAQATLPLLTAFVDKSLLRWDPAERRYQIHELLRQFCAAQLVQSPEALARLHDRQAEYYTGFAGDRFEALTGAGQQTALAEILADLGNIRVAWQWATNQRRCADLERAALALHTFYQYQGRFLEGIEAFTPAVAAVESAPPGPERDRALAVLLTCTSWLEMRFGRVPEATLMAGKALSLYEGLNLLPPPGQGTDPLTTLSMLAATRGDYDQARALGHQAWQRAERRADHKNMAFAGFGLSGAALAQGDYEAAQKYAQETLILAQAAENRWFTAYVYNHLGQIYQALGHLTTAGDYYQASFTLKEEMDDPEGMALALGHLGEIALAQSDFPRAWDLYQRSLAIYQELGDRGGLVRALHGLGLAAYELGDDSTTRQSFQRALQIASEAQLEPLILIVLAGIGAYLLAKGATERGLTTLAAVQRHPLSEQVTRDRVQTLLDHYATAGSPFHPAEISDLYSLVTTLLAELSTPIISSSDTPLPGRPVTQALLEPLSERELEVLALIAAGLRNREIADELTVTLSTVKAHINHIYGKLAVNTRVQAVAKARELGLL